MSKLIGIDGSKIVAQEAPPLPQEYHYQFVLTDDNYIEAFGVLVVTPGFVGVGNAESTEIRAIVPMVQIKYVTKVVVEQSANDLPQGTA